MFEKEGELDINERILLSEALRGSLSKYRHTIKVISAVIQNPKYTDQCEKFGEGLDKYRDKIRGKMEIICNKLVAIIEGNLMEKTQLESTKVFYQKMKGDYFRYLSEASSG